jgi:histidinol-phosphate aminotransferase
MSAYVPGEQPSDMEYIKLNTNEMPFPLPDIVAKEVEKELEKLHLYPNPDGTKLITKLAENYDVKPENIIVGNGSDELLAFAFLAFFEAGVAFPDITYGFYPVYAKLYDVPNQEIPLADDMTINIIDYTSVGKNVVLANPNAPTGITLGLEDIEIITKSNPDHVVVIDEAYIDFGGESAIPLTKKYDNLLVIHTYSKSRSMAGARLGFAIGSTALIEDLNKMKYSFNPYNVNRLTQILGEAALDNEAYFINKRNEIIEVREYTKKRLNELGFTLTDSKANFLFCKHPDIGGFELYSKLKDMGILIRQWNKPRISDYVRITIGTKEQMDELIAAIEQIGATK